MTRVEAWRAAWALRLLMWGTKLLPASYPTYNRVMNGLDLASEAIVEGAHAFAGKPYQP